MKTIDAYWESILKINCNCMGGHDYIEFQRDKSYNDNNDQQAYYVKFIDTDEWDFKTRLKTFLKIRKDWKKFIDGDCQTYSGIGINYNQLNEFYSTLFNDALENEILLNEDITKINNWKPQEFTKFMWKDDNAFDIILFKSKEDFVLAADIIDNKIMEFKMSWAFPNNIKKKNINKYTRKFLFNQKRYKFLCQENEMFLYKDDIVNMFSVINYILTNTKIDQGYNLEL